MLVATIATATAATAITLDLGSGRGDIVAELEPDLNAQHPT